MIGVPAVLINSAFHRAGLLLVLYTLSLSHILSSQSAWTVELYKTESASVCLCRQRPVRAGVSACSACVRVCLMCVRECLPAERACLPAVRACLPAVRACVPVSVGEVSVTSCRGCVFVCFPISHMRGS